MNTSRRKRKTKHIKLHQVGGTFKLQFGPKVVKIIISIPRQHLMKRLH